MPEKNTTFLSYEDYEDIDAYSFRDAACPPREGWIPIVRTGAHSSDDPVFGTWCHPDKRLIIQYAERDVSTIRCATDSEFAEQVRVLTDNYIGHGWGPVHLDVDPAPESALLEQRIRDLGLGSLLRTYLDDPDTTAAHAGHPGVSRAGVDPIADLPCTPAAPAPAAGSGL
jgi:hypothetical protein